MVSKFPVHNCAARQIMSHSDDRPTRSEKLTGMAMTTAVVWDMKLNGVTSLKVYRVT